MHLNATYKNSLNQKQNNVCVTLDSELYRRKPVLTYAINGNVVGGFGEFGEIAQFTKWAASQIGLHSCA